MTLLIVLLLALLIFGAGVVLKAVEIGLILAIIVAVAGFVLGRRSY